MRTLKIKDICNVAGSAAQSFLQSPFAPLGQFKNVRTVQISDIPEGITDAQVLKAWRETSDVSWLWNDGEYSRHIYRFAEIGSGRIIGVRVT